MSNLDDQSPAKPMSLAEVVKRLPTEAKPRVAEPLAPIIPEVRIPERSLAEVIQFDPKRAGEILSRPDSGRILRELRGVVLSTVRGDDR